MPSLDFKGKPFVYAHHLSVPFRELVIDPVKSLPGPGGPSLDDNLIIHGDNLEALKALLPRYAGKVDVIYIDPPYNTGNEGWAYNDNVNSPLMREWLGKVVDRDDLERHDKWLCMMWPRLQLLNELLKPGGVLFVSVDDNEQSSLHQILLEQFGERGWLGTIVWKNATDNNPTDIAVEHEYILCFAKDRTHVAAEWKSSISVVKDKLVQVGLQFVAAHDNPKEQFEAYSAWFREHKSELWPLDRYKYIDEGGVYTGSQSVHNPGREGYRYDILHPNTGKPCKQPLMGYRFPEETADWFVGEAGGYRIHLLYKPDLAFMRSPACAVSIDLARQIAKANTLRKSILLYGADRYVSQKQLSELGITFCQLPYAIHRLLGDGPTGDAPYGGNGDAA